MPSKAQKKVVKHSVEKSQPEKKKRSRNAISHNMTRKQLALFGCPRTSKGTREEVTSLAMTLIKTLIVATLAVTEQQKRVVIKKSDVETAYGNLEAQHSDSLFLY